MIMLPAHWQGFAHLICIGSYRQWEETVGLSAIELMMVGPLVITSEIAGVAKKSGTPRSFAHPCDAGALAAYTSTVIADSERAAALGRKAQGRALSTA